MGAHTATAPRAAYLRTAAPLAHRCSYRAVNVPCSSCIVRSKQQLTLRRLAAVWPVRPLTVAGAAQAAAQEQPAAQEESALQSFLRWLIANGVEGVGAADSKIALYQGEAGERGVVSLAPIAVGEVVMRIPLRLAITDAVDEEDEASEEAQQPWSVRLAGRLLCMLAEGVAAQQAGTADGPALLQCQLEKEEEGDFAEAAEAVAEAGQGAAAGGGGVAAMSVAQLQAGSASPWQPYLQVLPAAVPSPLTAFSWEDIQAIEYPPMRKELDHASWLAASAAQLPGGRRFSAEQWEWALSVVHSRTFGAPGRRGGVGVRMLVPLIDMLNHAGDYVTSPPGASTEPAVQAFDSVRWELRPPAGPEGEWHMEVAATRGIAAGEELLLSYGERSNDDFFLHYGFVPPRNTHDDVALFTDIESCIDWWLARYLPARAMPVPALQAAINAAYSAAEDQDSAAGAAEAVLAAVPEAEAEVIRAGLDRIKLSAGGMVDGRLLAAWRALYEAASAAGVPQQQQQQQAGQEGSQGQQQPALGGSWGQHLQLAVAARCLEILQGMPTGLLADLERLAAWEQQSGEAPHRWADAQRHYAAALAAHEARRGKLDTSAGAAATAAAEGGSSGTADDGGSAPALLDAGADAALAQLLLQQAQAQQPSSSGSEGSGGSGAAAGGSSMLPLVYRAYKKMALWDAVLLAEQ